MRIAGACNARGNRRGRKVRQRYALRYCGNGRLAQCRGALLASLAEAVAVPAEKVYPGDTACKAPIAQDKLSAPALQARLGLG